MDEFPARLRAAVRRTAAASDTDEPLTETSSFTVDLAAKKVTKNGSEVHLTPTEWGMLEMLVRNRRMLVGREELLKEVWGPATTRKPTICRCTWRSCDANWKRSVTPGSSAHRSRDGLPLPAVRFRPATVALRNAIDPGVLTRRNVRRRSCLDPGRKQIASIGVNALLRRRRRRLCAR